MRIAVITDIHAMAGALATALADARHRGFDVLLILGDLLTYGVEPQRTLDLVNDAAARDEALLVAGNHDAIYLDLEKGVSTYLASLPEWLRETVEWTAGHVEPAAMGSFDWLREWPCGPLLAAHANPYAFGDWRYISRPDAASAAAAALAARGYRYGLFGHSHRARRFDSAVADIVTLGALGQPRDPDDPRPQWAMVEVQDRSLTVESHPVDVGIDAHCAAIRATSMSPATQDRLCGFFA